MRVLSIPTGATMDLITKYMVHAFPHPRTYDFSGLVTFREKGGIMSYLYSVQETLVVDFSKADWQESINHLNPNAVNRIQGYVHERKEKFGFVNSEYMFWLMREEKTLPHKPHPFQNYNSHVYFRYMELCSGKIIVEIDSKNDLKRKTINVQLEQEFNEIESDNLNVAEKDRIIKGRIGQSIFKEKLKKRGIKCALCAIDKEVFLIASHIKPWKDCNTREKLDVDNGLLLCPNHDWLFDKGFISFNNYGDIIINSESSQTIIISMNLKKDMKINLNDAQKEYMMWHRKNCFKD